MKGRQKNVVENVTSNACSLSGKVYFSYHRNNGHMIYWKLLDNLFTGIHNNFGFVLPLHPSVQKENNQDVNLHSILWKIGKCTNYFQFHSSLMPAFICSNRKLPIFLQLCTFFSTQYPGAVDVGCSISPTFGASLWHFYNWCVESDSPVFSSEVTGTSQKRIFAGNSTKLSLMNI